MPGPSLIPVLVRELVSKRTLPREPEPDLVMTDQEQVDSYAHAGRIDGVMSSAYLFHSGRVSQVMQGCREVIDLGCGPATQLVQIAELNPGISFHGIDLSETMLERAGSYARERGTTNVRFSKGDITQLDHIDDQSVDGVMTTMVLHHLPTLEHLRKCFKEVARVLRPGGSVYLTDFGRLKSLKSVIYFAYINAKHQPHLFTLDYERSLRAAFTVDDFRRVAEESLPRNVQLYTTFLVPMLTLLKTADKPLPPVTAERLKAMRAALPRKYRADLDQIRTFFRLGKLDNDPFK
jgi:SAM-dependent methyltransferase